MNKGDKAEKRIIKDSLFPISLFAIYLGVPLFSPFIWAFCC